MGKPAARTTDPISAHSPCGPGQCGVGSPTVFIENKMAYCVGDTTFPHDFPEPAAFGTSCRPHTSTLVAGSSKVFVGGKALGRVGDAHGCGASITAGASKVIVG
jgi:uncharacterized Zn-binding protein involved in type VI secretion